MKTDLLVLSFVLLVLGGCIQDDFIFDEVDPTLRITNKVDSLAAGSNFQFEKLYLNNVGLEEEVNVQWSSSDIKVASIDETGLATALTGGVVTFNVTATEGASMISDEVLVTVGDRTVEQSTSLSGEIMTTSSYLLEGDFIMKPIDGDVSIELAENYRASTALPGLFIYLSNNRTSIAGALEIGAVEVFSGAHNYLVEDVGINDFSYILYYCKPFNIKVGEGKIQ